MARRSPVRRGGGKKNPPEALQWSLRGDFLLIHKQICVFCEKNVYL